MTATKRILIVREMSKPAPKTVRSGPLAAGLKSACTMSPIQPRSPERIEVIAATIAVITVDIFLLLSTFILCYFLLLGRNTISISNSLSIIIAPIISAKAIHPYPMYVSILLVPVPVNEIIPFKI